PVLIGSEKLEAIEAFRRLNPKAIPADFRIFHLVAMPAGSLKVLLELKVSPTTYILDREGRVAWRIPGEIPGALSAKVNHILSEPEPEEPGSR
ncbi:MAG: hypothetical protein KGN80_12510, partial [Acidobacteriota bacterium]|nr:hypothetical protein [Acidobacteriota bacterium]